MALYTVLRAAALRVKWKFHFSDFSIISNLGKGKSIIQATNRKQKNSNSKHQFLILMKMNDGQNILLLGPPRAVKNIAYVKSFSKRAF